MDTLKSLEILWPQGFSDHSKVWIFQSARPFGEIENIQIQEQIDQFVTQWKAHQHDVKGFGKLVLNNFLIFIADETEVEVSGCSIDGLTKLIKSIERQYQTSLLDRLSLMFYIQEKFERLPLNQLNYALENEYLTLNTIYFNNTVNTFLELKENWIISLKNSWLMNQVKVNSQ